MTSTSSSSSSSSAILNEVELILEPQSVGELDAPRLVKIIEQSSGAHKVDAGTQTAVGLGDDGHGRRFSSSSMGNLHRQTRFGGHVPQYEPHYLHQPKPISTHKKRAHFRKSSLPNLSHSSSTEDTSELIDQSELCIRSTIDLLLNDSYSIINYKYECSKEEPFIPHRISDLRLATRAKCILPGGDVGLVRVEGVDERREVVSVVHRGRVMGLLFRKVVYAWR